MSGDEGANPFAPTPLGKGWTPPGPGPRSADDTGLADLFDEGDGAPNEAPASAGTSGQGTLEEAAPEGGLADLFAAEDGTDAAPVATPASATSPQGTAPAPAPRPRVRRRGVPAALRGKNIVAADDEPDDAGQPAPTAPPVRPVADTPTPVPAAPREAAAAPRPRPVPAREPEPARTSLFDHGPDEIARAWQIVDQTIAIVQTDLALQHATSNVPLTADAGEYRAMRGEIHGALRRKMASAGISPSGVTGIETVLDLVVDEITGISVLGELFRDPSVDEILVDRWNVISVERHGHLERTPISFRSPQHAESCARVLALKVSDRAVSRAIPLVTAELPSARVTFAFGAVVKGGLSITIRKFRPLLGLDDLLRYGSLNEEMVSFLREAVQARAGILVSGGTGTGKTTIVNLLSSFIPDTERVVSIEDAFELKLANTHVVSLQTKEASSLDDTVSVTLAELLRNTLRMRPDRIIVGEIREGAGAMVMLAAASTGHDGTLTTVHANSADGAVNERLPDLVRQSRGGLETNTILRSIVNAFDLVVQVGRTRDGRRYLSQISAVAGVDESAGRIRLQPVFTGSESGGEIRFERHQLGSDTEIARRLARRKEN